MTQVEALMAIARRNDGLLRPIDVIEEARAEDSVLHGAFTWDDTEAAGKWRIHEAQMLIRSFEVKIEREGRKEVYPVFVGLSSDRDGAAANNPYRITTEMAKHEDLVSVAVSDALGQLNALKKRYVHLKQLSEVWDAVEEAARKV